MSGHTPGEWSLPHFAQPDVDCQCAYVLSDENCGAICTVHASGEGDWKITGDNPKFAEAVANARLIAAAPMLLEALQECRRVMMVEDSLNPAYGWADHISKHVDPVIAKATGELS